jgi:hypothetical protein
MLVGVNPSAMRAPYSAASPWPHLVVDDVVSREVAATVVAEAANMSDQAYERQHSRRQDKLSASNLGDLGPCTRALLGALRGPAAVAFAEAVTGISGLEDDPEFCRAGLFVTPRGGWQRVHEDFGMHPVTSLWNRVIMLLYCGEWEPDRGGELELWPADMSGLGCSIEPRPGRLVMFETTSAHRHGIRTLSPNAKPRVVLASRFYSVDPPRDPPSPPLLTWSPRPGERRLDVLPTVSEVVRELRVRARRRRNSRRDP